MKMTRTYAGVMLACAATLAAFATGALDPLLHLLGLSPDSPLALLMLANAPGAITTKTIAERIGEFTAKRAELVDKKNALVQKAIVDEGRTFDDNEAEQNAAFEADIKTIDTTLAQLKSHEAIIVSKANPVVQGSGAGQGAVQIQGSGPISVVRNLPQGTAYTRYVMCLAAAKGNLVQAERLAEAFQKDTPEVLNVTKAMSYLGATSGDDIAQKTAVAAGSTSSTTWAGPLVQYQDMTSEFIGLLRPMTVLGRLNGLRRVPFNVRMPRQTSGSTSQFVGEGLPAPVNALAFDSVTLPWSKASTIVVLTAELARMSNPAAESIVRQDLLEGCAAYLDKRLLDPAYAGVANVSPASLTNGVTAVQSTGATLAAVDANVRSVLTTFANAEQSLGNAVWVMSAASAIRLSLMRTNQDFAAFPGLTVNGGTFYGLPVIVSNNVVGSGSAGDQFLILINQSEVMLADEGQMLIDVSTEASIEMNDAPSGGATSLRSLWQNGLMGVKVDRWIHWTKRRSEAVQFIDKAQSYAS